MTDNHPITPPPELVQQWVSEFYPPGRTTEAENYVAIQAARWGADQELEACCQVLYARYDIPNCIAPRMAEDMREWLRDARRPKPPSLKEQAIHELEDAYDKVKIDHYTYHTIRRALEALPE